jgi:hypothetical protein
MTEKLLPCPFCGGEARTFDLNGTAQATCARDAYACAGPDVVAPVAMWNCRTPAPEGDACGGCGETDPAKRCIGCLHNFSVPASPIPGGYEPSSANEPKPDTDTGREG